MPACISAVGWTIRIMSCWVWRCCTVMWSCWTNTLGMCVSWILSLILRKPTSSWTSS
uniref:Uncharacterized protein n=1 Tax=Anguilla anguilla TaxID=7936 RepID=A0A0E9VEQ1_ANGAN